MIYHWMEQGSEAWHEIKLGRFTGTRFALLMMGKLTAGYNNCIAEVAAEILTHEKEENYVSEDMQRGIDLEPEAAKEYELITGIELKEVGFIEPDDNEYIGVSPDRLIDEDGLLEIKCPKAKTLFNYMSKGVLPNEYKWQVQGQLWVTKRQYCDFMAYYPKLTPFIIRVFPDYEMHKELEKEVKIGIEKVNEIISMYKKYDPIS